MVLKTLLFMTIMILQSVLTTAVYHHLLPQTHQLVPLASPQQSPTPSSLSLSVLRTLSHLSFVILQFGSVLSMAEGGFTNAISARWNQMVNLCGLGAWRASHRAGTKLTHTPLQDARAMTIVGSMMSVGNARQASHSQACSPASGGCRPHSLSTPARTDENRL